MHTFQVDPKGGDRDCICGEDRYTTVHGWRNVERGIAEAIEHGHPQWSHVFAHGPCTLTTRTYPAASRNPETWR